MNQYILQFESWLREEDKAEQTVRSYIGTMKSFVKWNEQSEGIEFQPKDISAIQIMDYRSYLLNTLEQKPSSVNRAIAGIKTFFGWASETGLIANNPSMKVKMKRIQQTHSPKWLTEKEQNRLLNALELEKNEAKQARDKAIVETMLKAGLRVEEICDLKIKHIDMREGSITVWNGKGGKYRAIPLHDDLKKALKIWLKYRQASDKAAHQQTDSLFVSERSGLMKSYCLYSRPLFGACRAVREGERRGEAWWNVARLAGHDSIQATQRYVEPSKDDLKKAIQAIK
jgi:site-specific recombinase XerD